MALRVHSILELSGKLSKVSDQADRAADRKTAIKIFAQSALYALLVTAAVAALPL